MSLSRDSACYLKSVQTRTPGFPGVLAFSLPLPPSPGAARWPSAVGGGWKTAWSAPRWSSPPWSSPAGRRPRPRACHDAAADRLSHPDAERQGQAGLAAPGLGHRSGGRGHSRRQGRARAVPGAAATPSCPRAGGSTGSCGRAAELFHRSRPITAPTHKPTGAAARRSSSGAPARHAYTGHAAKPTAAPRVISWYTVACRGSDPPRGPTYRSQAAKARAICFRIA